MSTQAATGHIDKGRQNPLNEMIKKSRMKTKCCLKAAVGILMLLLVCYIFGACFGGLNWLWGGPEKE